MPSTSPRSFVTSVRCAQMPSTVRSCWLSCSITCAEYLLWFSMVSILLFNILGSTRSNSATRKAMSSKSSLSTFFWWSASWTLFKSRTSAMSLVSFSSYAFICGTSCFSMRRETLLSSAGLMPPSSRSHSPGAFDEVDDASFPGEFGRGVSRFGPPRWGPRWSHCCESVESRCCEPLGVGAALSVWSFSSSLRRRSSSCVSSSNLVRSCSVCSK
mmetsp:Transcript_7178/g.20059  ORF Transcript_7178/g.20059 Transcript_7178/m.20059 type:complete len:214 (-) Transcript_7178:576-1217(-)